MEVVYVSLDQLCDLEPMVACIGYFDGLHMGHKKLIEETLRVSKEKSLKSACMTFDPDPWCVLKGMSNVSHITSMQDRIELASLMGLDYWIIVEFTRELASLEPVDFEKYLYDLHVDTLVCGFDYSYGNKGKGNVERLKQQDYFDVICVDEVLFENEKVSSTRIEKCIEEGKMDVVSKMLGYPYVLKGIVINGRSKGKSLGFPTANVKLLDDYVIPLPGVYISYVCLNGIIYRSMINIGHNPTFNYQKDLSIEAYILDFDDEIYDQKIELYFCERIRDEKKFDSIDALVLQLKEDVEKAYSLKAYAYKNEFFG